MLTGALAEAACDARRAAGSPVDRRQQRAQRLVERVGRVEEWQVPGLLDDQLGKHRYMLGDDYTLIDMAVWGWATRAQFALGDEAFARLANVRRHLDEISARPAAQRAVALKDKFAWKTEVDDEARKILFPQNAFLKA